jgi:hypothetical protein
MDLRAVPNFFGTPAGVSLPFGGIPMQRRPFWPVKSLWGEPFGEGIPASLLRVFSFVRPPA